MGGAGPDHGHWLRSGLRTEVILAPQLVQSGQSDGVLGGKGSGRVHDRIELLLGVGGQGGVALGVGLRGAARLVEGVGVLQGTRITV